MAKFFLGQEPPTLTPCGALPGPSVHPDLAFQAHISRLADRYAHSSVRAETHPADVIRAWETSWQAGTWGGSAAIRLIKEQMGS